MTKMLVVDDEQDVEALFRQKFRKEMRAEEMAVHFAFSGKEALSYLEQNGADEIHTILVDLSMPDMNGLELLRHIKERFPGPKVFIMTGYGDAENQQKAKEYGCDDYLIKPIDFSELKKKIL